MTMTPTMITREERWHAFRRPPDVRLRARAHGRRWRVDGRSGPEVAQGLDRDADPVRGWGPAFTPGGRQGRERAPSPGGPT